MTKIPITKITIQPDDPCYTPRKANPHDAAYDLFTSRDTEAVPNTRVYIPLGFKIALPPDIGMQIQPRSGQSGKGMIAYAYYPKWLGWISPKPSPLRINADVILGLIDSGYGEGVQAIVKFGQFRLKHRFLRLLGFKIIIPRKSRICQGRFAFIPTVGLVNGRVRGWRKGLGSTDRL